MRKTISWTHPEWASSWKEVLSWMNCPTCLRRSASFLDWFMPFNWTTWSPWSTLSILSSKCYSTWVKVSWHQKFKHWKICLPCKLQVGIFISFSCLLLCTVCIVSLKVCSQLPQKGRSHHLYLFIMSSFCLNGETLHKLLYLNKCLHKSTEKLQTETGWLWLTH